MSNRFSTLVEIELQRARDLYPKFRFIYLGYAEILQKLELVKVESFKGREDRDHVKILRELVKGAAMCQRLAEDLVIAEGIHDFTEDLIDLTPPTVPIEPPTKGGAA